MESTFEYYVCADGFNFKYAKGAPTLRGREFHDNDEFLYFMGGNASFVSKNIQQKLTAPSVVLIPRGHFHQFCVSDEASYKRCVFGFAEDEKNSALIAGVMDTVKIITSPDERVCRLFDELCRIAKSELTEQEKTLFVKAALPQLLIYFKENSSKIVNKNYNISQIVSRALAIMDERFVENLTVEKIALQLSVSPSTLSHKFKGELGISVYRYLTKKRLSEAYRLVRSGESLSSAAAKCGFSDYSCFYRLYKKYR